MGLEHERTAGHEHRSEQDPQAPERRCCPAIVPQVVDLSRPGLPAVQRVLGWHPLHVAAMSGALPCEGRALRVVLVLPGCRHTAMLPGSSMRGA